MRDVSGAFLLGDFDHAFGDERARDAGAEEILVFVDRPRLDHRKNEIARELLLEVVDVDLRSARGHRFLIKAFEFLLLPNVSAKGNHFSLILFLNPREEHRGVEPPRVCQNYLHHAPNFGQPDAVAKWKIGGIHYPLNLFSLPAFHWI